jgi:hypothetical protein
MKLVAYDGEVIPEKKDTTFEKGPDGFKLSTQEELKDKVGNDWWHGPANLIMAGTIGAAGSKVYDWLKSKETPPPPRIDPTFNGGPPNNSPNNPPIEKAPKGWEQILAKSQENAAAKAAEAAAKANPVPVGYSSGIPNAVSPMNQLTGGATPPSPIANAFLPPSPPPPSVSDTVATGGNVTKAVTQNIANDLDVLTKKEQGMKNWLLNQYGGKNEPMAHEAYSQVKNILGYTPAYPEGSKGGSLAPEEKGKILDWRKQELPGPKVNLTHDMKKALKIGGPVAAALIATTEFANAKTAEEKANAGANLLGAILPPGADIRDVGAPTLNNQQISNAALLGSPYAQTEWAKNQRLREKAGAGRGIAPPSAYFR